MFRLMLFTYGIVLCFAEAQQEEGKSYIAFLVQISALLYFPLGGYRFPTVITFITSLFTMQWLKNLTALQIKRAVTLLSFTCPD